MTNETNIKNEVEVTITIDSIDFVDAQDKHIHVQDAFELEKYIKSHGLYFDFFNQVIYRFFEEEGNGYIDCGNINYGNKIMLTFKLTNVSRKLQEAIESNQAIFYDFLKREAWSREAWTLDESANKEEKLGDFDYQLIDVAQIKQDEVTAIINSVGFGYFDEVDDYLQSGKIKVGDKIQIKFKLENISDELKKAISLHRNVFYDFFNNEVWIINEDDAQEKILGNFDYQIIDISTLSN